MSRAMPKPHLRDETRLSDWQIVFDVKLHLEPPQSWLANVLWRWRLWWETAFALCLLEPPEKVIVVSIHLLIWGLLLVGTLKYFPSYLYVIHERTQYYLFGDEADNIKIGQWALGNSTKAL